MQEIHSSVASHAQVPIFHAPKRVPGPQPRHVPWPGIKPTTLGFIGWYSIHWATPARATILVIHTLCSATEVKEILCMIWIPLNLSNPCYGPERGLHLGKVLSALTVDCAAVWWRSVDVRSRWRWLMLWLGSSTHSLPRVLAVTQNAIVKYSTVIIDVCFSLHFCHFFLRVFWSSGFDA